MSYRIVSDSEIPFVSHWDVAMAIRELKTHPPDSWAEIDLHSRKVRNVRRVADVYAASLGIRLKTRATNGKLYLKVRTK